MSSLEDISVGRIKSDSKNNSNSLLHTVSRTSSTWSHRYVLVVCVNNTAGGEFRRLKITAYAGPSEDFQKCGGSLSLITFFQ